MKKLFVRSGGLLSAIALAFAITPSAVAGEAPVDISVLQPGTQCHNPSVAWEVDLSGGGAVVHAEVDPGHLCFSTSTQ